MPNYLDYEPAEYFDPYNLEHWFLVAATNLMIVYVFWEVGGGD